jgi:surfeit locus 1 family protein
MIKLLPQRWPLVPTVIVLAAMAIMVALGFWQLGRAQEKDAMIARYTAAGQESGAVRFPRTAEQVDAALYRRSRVVCDDVLSTRSTASRDPKGNSGLAQVARCALDRGGVADIFLGFTNRPTPVEFTGGPVEGIIAPAADGARLVADPPTFGLSALPPPDPRDLPNNHLAYAGQWFFFALTALVIYALVLRKAQAEGHI